MSTVDFANKIHQPDMSGIMTRCFDEIMVLYNLLGDMQDMTISADNDSPSARFTLNMKSEEDANSLFESINNTYFSVYEDKYMIEMELSGRSIHTVIYKAIS